MRKREPPKAVSSEQCAEIILKDPEKYPGIMQEFARLVLEKNKNKANQ